MFTVDVVSWGLKLRSEGFFSADAAKEWGVAYHEKLREVVQRGKPFGQYVDLRGFLPGPVEAQNIIVNAMKAFKESGGERSVGIMDNPLAVMQIRRLSKESGMYQWERYLDPETFPDFEKVALAWIVDGKDPDLK